MANVLNTELQCLESEQGPGLGGAMLAMVTCGEYPNVQAACGRIVRVTSKVCPAPKLAAKYETRYGQFKHIYPSCKQVFANFAKE